MKMVDTEGNFVDADREQVAILKEAGWLTYAEFQAEIRAAKNHSSLKESEGDDEEKDKKEKEKEIDPPKDEAPTWLDVDGKFVKLSDADFKLLSKANKMLYAKAEAESK